MSPARLLEWMLHNVDPQTRRTSAAWVILLSTIAWPMSALTIAKHEPQVVLGLSWAAIILTALDVFVSTDVRVNLDERPTEAA